jgi:hypothetical protein
MPTRDIRSGRYLLFLDILGFTDLVETKGIEQIYRKVNDVLAEFSRWERLNGDFRTIYFSDTFIFYQQPKGYGDWAFLDIYAIGAMILSALLAKGIPARGTISFGQFEVQADETEKHQLYFGEALVEAYRAEMKENWIGITILESAWSLYDQSTKGNIDLFAKEAAWIKRKDNVLLLNPFTSLFEGYIMFLCGEFDRDDYATYSWQLANDVQALKFLVQTARNFVKEGDFSGKVAMKYHSTVAFLKAVLGDARYQWALDLSAVPPSK